MHLVVYHMLSLSLDSNCTYTYTVEFHLCYLVVILQKAFIHLEPTCNTGKPSITPLLCEATNGQLPLTETLHKITPVRLLTL